MKSTVSRTTREPLEEAIAQAVAQGKAEATRLQGVFDVARSQIKDALQQVESCRHTAEDNGDSAREVAQGMAAKFIEQVLGRDAQMASAFAQQQNNLESVNLALFGRTGAGKSSLIEALTRGDGSAVSPGHSDWTKEVQARTWQGSRVFDTPGTNGWSERRPELEAEARRAVEIADVVLLCFDTQSQQQSEFNKVAEWIHAYGKPTVAILNCRNQVWRVPARVPMATARRTIADHVRQHEGHIQDELHKLGLHGVPVVAISAKRALFARATEPFKGPDRESFQRQRAELDAGEFLRSSNLEVLEGLIAEALRLDAPGLRLGMLVAGVEGHLAALRADVQTMEREARELGETLDANVTGMLRVLGYPVEVEELRKPFWDEVMAVDLIARLEQLRGGRFEVPVEGEFQTMCGQLITGRLAPLRSRALVAGEEAVLQAFTEGRSLTGQQLNETTFDTGQMDGQAEKVLAEVKDFLIRKVKLAVADGQTDLACQLQEAADTNGGAGKVLRILGTASRVAGLLTGAAVTTMLALAVANVWNPVGWALFGVAVGGTILSSLFSWGGGAAARKAEEERTRTRSSAIASARRHVNDTFDAFEAKVAAHAAAEGRTAASHVLRPLLREAIAAQQVRAAGARIAGSLEALEAALPKRKPQAILGRAARQLEQRLAPGNPGRWLWLGEDWTTDPSGLVAERDDEAPVNHRRGPRVDNRIKDAIRDAFGERTGRPRRGDGLRWIGRVTDLLADVPDAAAALEEVRAVLAANRPRLVLLGDYNAGKSSFIKRLLIEAGKPIPESLQVRSDPTTRTVHEYEWEGLTLVDSPGFQSGRDREDQSARRSLWDASHVICLFQPNVLGSTVEELAPLLRGDVEVGQAPKLARTLLVLNRADELGIDPLDDPEGFERLAVRKRAELIKAFASRRVDVPEGRVLAMASDPFGAVGNRKDVNAAHYDAFRGWDGFNAFSLAVKQLRDEAKRVGADIAGLQGGMARLGDLRASQRQRLGRDQDLLASIQRLHAVLTSAVAEAARIRSHVEAKLDTVMEETTRAHLQDALGAATDEELHEAAKALAHWWDDKSFVAGVKRWEVESQMAVDRWHARVREEVGRPFASKEFLRGHPEARAAYDASAAAPNTPSRRQWWNVMEVAAKAGSQRNVVYAVVKTFGGKFKPWGAVKMAAKIGKAGAILSALGVVIDAYDWYTSAKAAKSREGARQQAAGFLDRSRTEVRASLLVGTGPVAYLEETGREIERLRDEMAIEVNRLAGAVESGRTQIKAITKAIALGRASLGLSTVEETDV